MRSELQLEFRASHSGQSQNELLRDYLQARPGQWVAMPELAAHIRAYAVHSRVADCRVKYGMAIEHRSFFERGHARRSFYRYQPD